MLLLAMFVGQPPTATQGACISVSVTARVSRDVSVAVSAVFCTSSLSNNKHGSGLPMMCWK